MDETDSIRVAAQSFARGLTDDDQTYAQVFLEAYTIGARMEAERARAASLRAMGVNEPPSVREDSVYLANTAYVVDDVQRIIGGAPTAEFPECVAVGSLAGFCCSGTLIAPRLVLTAAHCARAGCSRQVLIGEDVSNPAARKYFVTEVVVHPEYGSGPFNDLALLILSEPVVGVAPREIAQGDAPERAKFVRLVGYGATDSNGKLGYGVRRTVDVPVATPDAAYGADPATEFVAGAPFTNMDTCPGDSGGPAYVEIDGEWLLAGVTSRATKGGVRICGDGGVYERAGAFTDWIRSVSSGQ